MSKALEIKPGSFFAVARDLRTMQWVATVSVYQDGLRVSESFGRGDSLGAAFIALGQSLAETWVIDGVNQDFSSKAEAEQFLLELMKENGDTVTFYGMPRKGGLR